MAAANQITIKMLEESEEHVREPLRTLFNQNRIAEEIEDGKAQNVENLAGPSDIIEIDTRYVTFSRGDGELDWNFEVFKDTPDGNETKDTEIKTEEFKNQSRDEKLPEHMEEFLSAAASENIHETSNVPIDPARTEIDYVTTLMSSLKPPSDFALKKVKRSLERPESAPDTCPLSAKPIRNDPSTHNNKEYMADYLTYLLKIEKKIQEIPKVQSITRSCVINWIMSLKDDNSGCPLVEHQACWYLDSYLATNFVPSVSCVQVIAATCFWIASKTYGRFISASQLVLCSGNAFGKEQLVLTERHVLRKLNFETLCVTPFDFIPYLSWCCDATGSGQVEAAALFLCQCGLMIDKTLNMEYPSVIAAAAVKTAVILLRETLWLRELKNSFIYKEAEAKAINLSVTCGQLREAVRVVASPGYEYKAPLLRYSAPPYYIATRIVRAVSHSEFIQMEAYLKNLKETQ